MHVFDLFSRSVLSHSVVSTSLLPVDPWTVTNQVPLSMEFSRQDYQSRLPFRTPWDLPDPGTEPASGASPALAGGFLTTSATWEAHSAEGLAHKWLSKWISRDWLFATPRTLQFMKFSGPEYWSGQSTPSPGYLPNPDIEPGSPALQADSLPAGPQGKP